jgi:glucan 1,3-beta-glucosidase
MHAAPGGQSGEQASGFSDPDWTPCMWDAEGTVACLAHLAAMWGEHPALEAITVINEPSNQIPASKLLRFYLDAYDAIREHTHVTVVMRRWARLEFTLVAEADEALAEVSNDVSHKDPVS